MKRSGKILLGLLILCIFIGAEVNQIYSNSNIPNPTINNNEANGALGSAEVELPKKPYSLKNLVIELQNVTENKIDTDSDGLYDSVEAVLGTDFNNIDSDFDNLND
ncbi:MAG TPA: hypothetical protein VMV49_10425, partial [Candidatus Deferrimicrobium sp.]|nr:hypothetical protein [Candidatus Deferrimicrobium sp.]